MRGVITGLLTLIGMAACTSVDCSIASKVVCNWQFEAPDSAARTLNVSVASSRVSDGNDTVIINNMPVTGMLNMPMSYAQNADTLYLAFIDNQEVVGYDVVIVEKTNEPYFEDIDCGARMHHTIQSVMSSHNFIDSIYISSPKVNTDAAKENLHIVLRPAE